VIRALTFDIGGVIFSDEAFKRAIFQALNQLSPGITQSEFDEIYWQHLKNPDGSLRNKLTKYFLKDLNRKQELMKIANNLWRFEAEDLYQDAKSTLSAVKKQGLKIGAVANQPATVVDDLKREQIFNYFDALAISALEGVEKPDSKLFQIAIDRLQIPADQIVHVGNRIDTDVVPAKSLGMKTIWVRRGEANPNPSADDLKLADLVVSDLLKIPELIKQI